MKPTINLQDLEKVETPAQPQSNADKLEQALELPEKYRGKSISDVVKMHEEAEKALSRQGQELGEYRKLTDTLLTLEQTKVAKKDEEPTKSTPVTTEDLFSDADATISRAVEQNPVVQKAASTAEALERELMARQFENEYPEYQKDLSDPQFAEWVQKSKFRVTLAKAADQYDFEAARGLWQMWGEYKELNSAAAKQAEDAQKATEAKARRQKALEDASLEGGSTGDGAVDTIYDRKKVMDLRIRALKGDKVAAEKLKKFNATKVYAEGRIR